MNPDLIVAMTVALIVCLVWIPIPSVVRRFQTARLSARCKARNSIVLSFDDGPEASVTPHVLDLLKESDTKASFFLIGEKASASTDLVARLLAEGHEVGSHTQRHFHAWKTLPWRSAKDIEMGAETVERLGGREDLFRPPWGKITALGLLQNVLAHRTLAWWTIDSGDSYVPRTIEDVLGEIRRKGGGIVLMHDINMDEVPQEEWTTNCNYILALTRSIIEFAQVNGYRICRLGDLTSAKH